MSELFSWGVALATIEPREEPRWFLFLQSGASFVRADGSPDVDGLKRRVASDGGPLWVQDATIYIDPGQWGLVGPVEGDWCPYADAMGDDHPGFTVLNHDGSPYERPE